MNRLDVFRLAISSIVQNRMRAGLTVLGIIFGVMAVIAVVSITQGVFFVYTSQLESLGAGFLFVLSGNPRATDQVRANPELEPEDALALLTKSNDVRAATPYFFDRRSIKVRGQTINDIVIMPTNTLYPEIQNHYVEAGRYFSVHEARRRSRVVVVGPDLAADLGFAKPIGKEVRLYGVPFTIVGVMEQKDGINAFGQPFDRAALVPYETAVSLGGKRGGGLLLVKLSTVDNVDRSAEEIRRILRVTRRLQRGDSDDFHIVTQSDLLKTVGNITGLATWVILAIVGVALLVGGIGIMNVMLVSVTERTREIGVRRAVGATPGDILAQFLVEAGLLGLIGGLLGILLGFGVSLGISAVVPDFPPPHIPAWAVLLAFFSSALIGVVFGSYPAARASRLDPIDALRFE